MEGTESERIFDVLNLNPQLFANEVINVINETVDDAFDVFQEEALKCVKEDESTELKKGISSVRGVIERALDKQMDLWEKYCLRHCFVVHEGFTLSKADTPGDSLMEDNLLGDAELDDQLNSVREKLHAAGKESAELQRELHGLKQQNNLGQKISEAVTEALQPYEQNSVQELFEEMVRAAPTLREKLTKMNTKKREEAERIGIDQSKGADFNAITYGSMEEQYMMQRQSKGLPAVELQLLGDFIADIRNL